MKMWKQWWYKSQVCITRTIHALTIWHILLPVAKCCFKALISRIRSLHHQYHQALTQNFTIAISWNCQQQKLCFLNHFFTTWIIHTFTLWHIVLPVPKCCFKAPISRIRSLHHQYCQALTQSFTIAISWNCQQQKLCFLNHYSHFVWNSLVL